MKKPQIQDEQADNVERLKAALRAVIEDPSIDDKPAEDLCGAYPAVRYVTLHSRLPGEIGCHAIAPDVNRRHRAGSARSAAGNSYAPGGT